MAPAGAVITVDQETIDANHALAETIKRSLGRAEDRVRSSTEGKELGDSNIRALVAFEAMRAAQEERHNLRSMQAWLAVKVARDKLYLDFPPTDEYPGGFGNLKEWLRAVGIRFGTLDELNYLGTIVAPMLEERGIKIEPLLNSDRYPKLAETITVLKHIAEGKEKEHTAKSVIEDVSKASSRDDMRVKYRQQVYVADGAINKSKGRAVITIVTDEDSVGSFVSSLRTKVEWHLSATVQEKDHEYIVRVPKNE